MSETEKVEGAFLSSLKRNNKKIREDRAEAIGEDAQLLYKRQVEDLRVAISRMKREQENMLDLSPENSMSLMVASDFDAPAYVAKDIELGVKIRNETIKLEIAEARYNYLFGEV
jgi:UDP-3-O-acyl-N-acetylglucosamine deacetylase